MRIDDQRKAGSGDGFGLDIRPLAAPVSPFAWYAQQLRDAEYPDARSLATARELLDWCEYLARALPELRTSDPVLAAAMCKAACCAPDRALLTRACADIERVVQAAIRPPASDPAPVVSAPSAAPEP